MMVASAFGVVLIKRRPDAIQGRLKIVESGAVRRTVRIGTGGRKRVISTR
jgi:hypothetical protein